MSNDLPAGTTEYMCDVKNYHLCGVNHWLFLYWRRIIRLGELGKAYFIVRLIIRLSINTDTKTIYPSRRIISVVRQCEDV